MADEAAYKLKITTVGDTKGADAVAKSLRGVDDATKGATAAAGEQGKAARGLTDDLGSLASGNNATKDVVEGLDTALRGNATSFFGVAKAAKNLWEVLTVSTPMGRIIQLGLIAINTFALLSKRFGETGEEAKRMGAATEKAIEHAAELAGVVARVGESGANAGAERLREQFSTLSSAADQATARLKALIAVRDELANEKLALELARIDAGQGTNVEKLEAKAAARARFEAEALNNTLGDLAAQEQINQERATGARSLYEQTKQQTALAQAELQRLTALAQQRAQLEENLRLAEETLKAAQLLAGLTMDQSGQMAPEVLRRFNEALTARDTARAGLQGAPTLDQIVPKLAISLAQLEGLLKDIDEAGQKAIAETTKLANERELNRIKGEGAREVSGVRSERTEVELGPQRTEAAAKDADQALRDLSQSAAAIAEQFKQLANSARLTPQNFFDSPETRAQKTAQIDEAAKQVDAAASKLGDGRDEGRDLAALAAAVDRLVQVVPRITSEDYAQQRRALEAVTSKVNQLESVLANGRR